MSTGNPVLDKAIALAGTLMTRPDGRAFCRPSAASGLKEITPRVARALRLAQQAAPHLQRQVLLARKMALAKALGSEDAGLHTRRNRKASLEAIPEEVRTALENLLAEFEATPPTEAEREILEAAAVGTWGS